MRQATSILQVVVLQITHLSGVVILQQAQRTVEAQHLAAQVERRKPARLVGAERPVRGEKRIFGDHRGDRMVLRRIDRLVERQAELDLSPARNLLPNRILRQRPVCPDCAEIVIPAQTININVLRTDMNFIGYYSEIVTQSGILHNTIINQEPSTHHKNIPGRCNRTTTNRRQTNPDLLSTMYHCCPIKI